jgi:hypothetical protein
VRQNFQRLQRERGVAGPVLLEQRHQGLGREAQLAELEEGGTGVGVVAAEEALQVLEAGCFCFVLLG